RLVGGRAEEPVVHALAGERRREGVVDAPLPPRRAGDRVARGVADLDERLAAAVATLLTQVGAEPGAAVVPHEGRGVEADLPAAFDHAPAHIDVVAGGSEDRVEPAGREQYLSPERHVAAGHVL